MQKHFRIYILVIFSSLLGCSSPKEKQINIDEFKNKISGKITSPSLGEETEVQSYQLLNQGVCKYLVTQNKIVQYVDSTKMDVRSATKYDLLTSGSTCPRLPSDSKLDSTSLQILKSQFLRKVDNLTIEAMFVNQVSTARSASIQSLKEERYKNMEVATVVIKYKDDRDNRFYTYTAHISMDSYFLGVFDIIIKNMNGEIVDQTFLTHAKLNNPVVNYP